MAKSFQVCKIRGSIEMYNWGSNLDVDGGLAVTWNSNDRACVYVAGSVLLTEKKLLHHTLVGPG